MKFDILVFFKNLWRKFKFYWNQTRITGTSHEDQYTFLIYLTKFFLEREILQINCRENQNTHFMLNNLFFSKIVPFMNNVAKYGTAGQYGTCALHAGYLKLQIHTQLLLHCSNGCTNTLQCHVIRTLPGLLCCADTVDKRPYPSNPRTKRTSESTATTIIIITTYISSFLTARGKRDGCGPRRRRWHTHLPQVQDNNCW